MIEAGWLIAAVVSTMLSMGWFALCYPSHWKQVFPGDAGGPNTFMLKLLGRGFLLLSAVCCLAADHPSMAALVWIMLLAVAAMAVAMLLSRRPRWLRFICPPFFATKG